MNNTISSVAILVLATFLAACGPSKDELAQAECLVLSATHPFDLAGRLERMNDFRTQIGEPLGFNLDDLSDDLADEVEFIVSGDNGAYDHLCVAFLLNDADATSLVAAERKKNEEFRRELEKRKLVLSAWRFSSTTGEVGDSANLVIHTTIDNTSDYSDLNPPTLLVHLTDRFGEMISEHVFLPNRDFSYDQETKRIQASLAFPDTPLGADGFRLFACQPGEVERQTAFEVWGQAVYLEDKDLTCAIYE